MSINPFVSGYRNAVEESNKRLIDTATVVAAPNHTLGDDDKHVVKVKPKGVDTPVFASMTVAADGDVRVPTEGTRVLIAYLKGERPVVIDVFYDSESSVPSYERGERRIGHELSNAHVTLDANGNVTVENDDGTTVEITDSSVVIDGGTQGVIEDVQTTKNTDGYVTDVTLVRNDTVLI